MVDTKKCSLIGSKEEYERCAVRYQQIKYALIGTEEHKEKLLLVHLISDYGEKEWDLPVLDAVEFIEIMNLRD